MYQHTSRKPHTARKLNILIANNKPVEREGISALLSEKYDTDLITAPFEHHALIETLSSRVFDFIIVDSNLPWGSAYDLVLLIRQMKGIKPRLPILVMGSGNHHIALWVLQAGATGYVDKGCDQEELVASTDCMIQGRKYLNRDIAEQLPLIWNKPGELVLPHNRLSDREYQVMLFLAKGITVTEIGKTMKLSKKTISTYRRRMLEKMGMATNIDLIRYTIKHGLVTASPGQKTISASM